jgi:hypothetical protein
MVWVSLSHLSPVVLNKQNNREALFITEKRGDTRKDARNQARKKESLFPDFTLGTIKSRSEIFSLLHLSANGQSVKAFYRKYCKEIK